MWRAVVKTIVTKKDTAGKALELTMCMTDNRG